MLRALLHPLLVTVTETTGTDRRTYRHRARNLADALEWAACYPKGTRVVIRSRLGRTLALREA